MHQNKKDSVLRASGHIPGQFLAKACDSCKLSVQIPEESGQTFGGGFHCWEGKGGLLIRQTTSSSGNPLSWKCLKAVWMLGRKYFISLPCSCFTLDIHLLPFLGKRFWTLNCPSTVSLASLGGIFLTAGQSSWWILKKIIPSWKSNNTYPLPETTSSGAVSVITRRAGLWSLCLSWG